VTVTLSFFWDGGHGKRRFGDARRPPTCSRRVSDGSTLLAATISFGSVAGGFSENLLLLEFRDGLGAAGFADGKCDFVARVQGIQHAVLYLELFGSSAGIRSDSAALRLLNGDGPTNPIDCGDRSRKRLLSQRHRTDDREHRTSQNHLCQSHWNPRGFEQSEISRNQRIGSLVPEFPIGDKADLGPQRITGCMQPKRLLFPSATLQPR